MEYTQKKYACLQQNLKEMGRAAIAFSGGTDSAFLLKAAAEALGADSVFALTVTSAFFPERERSEAREFCVEQHIRQIEIPIDVLAVEGVPENPIERCYLCKYAMFQQLLATAGEQGMCVLLEGSNMDDAGDYRPGFAAVQELGVHSPLREAGLYKEEIRSLSKELLLSTWDKPACACLASRFAYGEHLTAEKLSMAERAEAFLFERGIKQLRVRVHGDETLTARIELLPSDFFRLQEEKFRAEVCETFRALGFTYVTLDLGGFRSGSMNEGIGTGKVG